MNFTGICFNFYLQLYKIIIAYFLFELLYKGLSDIDLFASRQLRCVNAWA